MDSQGVSLCRGSLGLWLDLRWVEGRRWRWCHLASYKGCLWLTARRFGLRPWGSCSGTGWVSNFPTASIKRVE